MNRKYEAVVAYDEARGIGYNDQLPWSFRNDMQWFRQLTMGGLCIAGKRTYDSILDATKGKGLDGRIVIVVSSGARYPFSNYNYGEAAYIIRDLELLDTFTDILKSMMRSPTYPTRPMFVIGGESIYNQLMPQVQTVWATEIKGRHKADRFFPTLTGKWQSETIRETDQFTIKRYGYESPTVSV